MLKTIAGAAALVLMTAAAAPAQPSRPDAKALEDVTGVWVMMVEGHQFALELEQKGAKVEGVMNAMGRRILLVGDYVERKLTLKGERPEDGIAHGGDAGPIVATMLDDGTLEGELSTNRGRTKWTGERFKKP